MRRSLGITWFVAAAISAAAMAAAAAAVLLDSGPELTRVAMLLGLAGCVLGLAATPLALAPAEALRASLGAREAGTPGWGEERADLWGALARDIARVAAPREAPDHGVDIRRLAANLELTLRQTGEELATVRAGMGDAVARLDGAAQSGERLSAVAAEATRRLAEAVQRTDDAAGALAVLPALAAEQAASVEKAAVRSLAAAEALEAAASRPPARPEPAGDEIALRDAALRGAEQARRLEQAMPLLIEAVARLPVAAASQQALAATAARLADGAGRMEAGLARLEALPAGHEAADAVATRVADIAEVMALEAAWRVGEAAEQAALRRDAARAEEDGALRIAAAGIVDRAEGLLVRLENLGVAPATQPVSGEARLDTVADRLTAALVSADAADGLAAPAPTVLLSLEETIRRLQEPRDEQGPRPAEGGEPEGKPG